MELLLGVKRNNGSNHKKFHISAKTKSKGSETNQFKIVTKN